MRVVRLTLQISSHSQEDTAKKAVVIGGDVDLNGKRLIVVLLAIHLVVAGVRKSLV